MVRLLLVSCGSVWKYTIDFLRRDSLLGSEDETSPYDSTIANQDGPLLLVIAKLAGKQNQSTGTRREQQQQFKHQRCHHHQHLPPFG